MTTNIIPLTCNPLTRKYADHEDPKTVRFLVNGKDALLRRDFQTAMRNFKKAYKNRITRGCAALLLNQMAYCMDQLEFYDQQQTFLEELVEIEPNFKNIEQLMRLYIATNNEPKRV